MEEIIGKYNTAISFAKTIESTAREQIRRMCNYEFTQNSKIRMMTSLRLSRAIFFDIIGRRRNFGGVLPK